MVSAIRLRNFLFHHTDLSRVILPVSSTNPAIAHVLPPTFSPTLSYIRLHPPEVLIHLSRAFLLPPPADPNSNMQKFWSIFSPFVQRERREAEPLVFSQSGSQSRAESKAEETVVEVLVRSSSSRKGVERSLNGWRDSSGPCELTSLITLRECYITTPNQGTQMTKDAPVRTYLVV
jgi:elongator complex protein 5